MMVDVKKSRYSTETPMYVLQNVANTLEQDVQAKKAAFEKAKRELDATLAVQENVQNIIQEKKENIKNLDSYKALTEFFNEGIFNKNEHRKNYNKLLNTDGEFTIYFQNSGQSHWYLGCHHAIKELLREMNVKELELSFEVETSTIRQNNYDKKEILAFLSSEIGISRGIFRNITNYPEEK